MDYKWVKLLKFGSFKKFELNIPSCRAFYGLSEYHKLIVVRQTEQKLWPVKDSAIFTSDLRMYLILCTHTHTHSVWELVSHRWQSYSLFTVRTTFVSTVDPHNASQDRNVRIRHELLFPSIVVDREWTETLIGTTVTPLMLQEWYVYIPEGDTLSQVLISAISANEKNHYLRFTQVKVIQIDKSKKFTNLIWK